MSRNKEELCLSSRYIHTGNSGVSLYVVRDTIRTDRARLLVENGAMGAFSTKMTIGGNECTGMTSLQLRDLALMLLDAAHSMDNPEGISSSLLFENSSPSIVSEDGTWHSVDSMPSSIRHQVTYGVYMEQHKKNKVKHPMTRESDFDTESKKDSINLVAERFRYILSFLSKKKPL